MARTSYSSSDVFSKICEIEAVNRTAQMDSLFMARSVDPWHGHGIEIPDNFTVSEMLNAAFPSGNNIKYSPLHAIHPDAGSNIQNMVPDLDNLIMKIQSGNPEDSIVYLFDLLEKHNITLPMPFPGTDSDGNTMSHRRRGLVRGDCPDYRGVILKGEPNHLVPALQTTRPLGIVGSSHVQFTPDDMIRYLDALGRVYGAKNIKPITAGTIDNGGIAFCSSLLEGMEFKGPTSADRNISTISLIQGFAGNLALTESHSNTTIVCRNTATHVARDKKAIKTKHTKNMHSRIEQSLSDRINQFIDQEQDHIKDFSIWADRAVHTKVQGCDVEDYLGIYLFGRDRWNDHVNGRKYLAQDGISKHDALITAYQNSPGQRDRGVNPGTNDGTVWGLYNAVIFVNSHVNPTTANNPYKLTFDEGSVDQQAGMQYIYNLVG